MMKNLISLLISVMVLAACNSSSSSIPLSTPTPPANPGEQGGDAKPTPTPTPGEPSQPGQPTPEPGKPTPTPSPTPKPEKVARLYCMDQPSGNAMLYTLRADAVENYNMPSIRFFNSKNDRIYNVKTPVPLQSNGSESTVLFAGTMAADGNWDLYKAKVDLLKQDGVAEKISTYGSEPNQYAYVQIGLPIKMMDANISRDAFVYPSDSGTFVIQNSAGKKTSLPVSASSYSNPRFVRDSWVVFDYGSGSSLSQRFYSVKTGKVSSFSSGSSFQLFGYVTNDGNFLWVEGRPGSEWKIKSSKTGTILTLPGTSQSVQLPVVFFEKGGQTYAAYVEEQVGVDDKGKFAAKVGNLRLIGLSSSLKVITNKKVEYPQVLQDMLKGNVKQTPVPQGLRNLFFEPISGQLYASIVVQGGVISYDIENNSWGIHASFYPGCLTPSWGIEVIRE